MDLLKEVAGLKVSSLTHMAVSKLDQILWNIMEHANTGLVVSEFLTSGSLILQLSIYWELVCWTSRFPSRMHHLDPGFQHGPWGPNSPGKNNGFRSISIAIQSTWHKARRCGDWPLLQAFWHCYVLLKQGLLHWSFTDGHVLLKVIIFLHFVWDLPWFADISWRLYIISFCNVFFFVMHPLIFFYYGFRPASHSCRLFQSRPNMSMDWIQSLIVCDDCAATLRFKQFVLLFKDSTKLHWLIFQWIDFLFRFSLEPIHWTLTQTNNPCMMAPAIFERPGLICLTS